ncbi:MAG: glutaredoxin 3 [Alphaproteobacteria bacterium]|nr:MAG: glutaredoxin 3 [Alphaproteobacteria bacterium]
MNDVTIYTKFGCGYCHLAKKLLKAKGVAFTEHDVTFDKARRQEMIERAGGRTTVPQIFIGATHVGGSDELRALEAAGRLDALLEGRHAAQGGPS